MNLPRREESDGRLVRFLLRLYPAEFRERYGEEMRAAYRAQKEARRGLGRAALLALGVRTALGMARGAAAERKTRRIARTGGDRMGTGVMEAWKRELGQAGRRLRRSPGFTTLAVATLALGTGAFAAVFAVVESVLLEPMPYERSEELAWVWRESSRGIPRARIGSKEVEYLREDPGVEAVVITLGSRTTLAGLDGRRPRDVHVTTASTELLEVLGVRPLLGRDFRPEDGEPGAPPVVLLRHDLWQDAFGADPGVVGRTIALGGEPARVVGVLPPGFDFLVQPSFGEPLRADLYRAFQTDLDSRRPGAGWLTALVRFRGGPESPTARAALLRVGDRYTAEFVRDRSDYVLRLWAAPLKEDLVGGLKAPLTGLLAAGGFLLLVLGANLATLLISRGATRERDLAVRAAIGGSRRAVASSVLAEGVLVALAGAAGGVLVGRIGADVLAGVATDTLPRAAEIALDGTGAAVAICLALALGLMATLPPALRGRSTAVGLALRDTAGTGASRRGSRSRDALVVVQVALSLVLLVGGGLLARSLAELLRIDPGFDPSGTLTFRVALDGPAYDDAEAWNFERSLRERLVALPGIEAVGLVNALPLGQETYQTPLGFPHGPGDSEDGEAEDVLADLFFASPGYVHAAGLRLLEGRDFREGDGPAVALVDDVLATRFFPDGAAVGSRVATGSDTVTIVGVVDHARFYDVRADDRIQVYRANASIPLRWLRVAVRVASDDPLELMPSVRAVVAELDPRLAVSDVRTLEGMVSEALGQERLNLGLVASFALAALLLAGLGIYGVVSNGVVRRRPEIGVRMALGAEAGNVERMVLLQGLRLVLAGVAVGIVGAWGASRFAAALLYGVDPRDPLTFGGVAALLLGVGAVAAWLPARRATRVDPLETLRAE